MLPWESVPQSCTPRRCPLNMQRGVFGKTGTLAVHSGIGTPDSVLAVRSPLVSVQLSGLVKLNNSST